MKTKYFISMLYLFSYTLLAQWNSIQNDLPFWGVQGHSIDAINSDFAIIAVNPSQPTSTLFKTENGGLIWEGLSLPQNLSFIDVEFIDENFIIGCSATPPQIWGTTDKGTNWHILFDASSTTNFLNYIEMFDLSNGIAMGDAISSSNPAMFYKTIDGGQSWQSINSNLIGSISSYDWRAIDFINVTVGYYYDGISRKLYKSINSGGEWSEILDFATTAAPTIIKFYDESIGMLCLSYSNQIMKTLDGGQSWLTYSLPNNSIADDIEFLPNNPMKLWLVTMSELFFSLDGGSHWQIDPIAGSFQYGRDMVINNNVGWFLSEHVYRNENIDRVTEVQSETSIIPKRFILEQNYPNPFNSVTRINFQLPYDSYVTLKIYDAIGNEVITLVTENKVAGNYNFDFNASAFASGVYFYKLRANDFVQNKKMILIK